MINKYEKTLYWTKENNEWVQKPTIQTKQEFLPKALGRTGNRVCYLYRNRDFLKTGDLDYMIFFGALVVDDVLSFYYVDYRFKTMNDSIIFIDQVLEADKNGISNVIPVKSNHLALDIVCKGWDFERVAKKTEKVDRYALGIFIRRKKKHEDLS